MSYIWEREVSLIEGKKVTFADGTVEKFTKKQLNYLVTDTPQDLSEVRNNLLLAISADLLKVIEEYDIKRSDLAPIVNTVVDSYNRSFKIAIGKAFGTYAEDMHHDYFEENIKISDIARILKK